MNVKIQLLLAVFAAIACATTVSAQKIIHEQYYAANDVYVKETSKVAAAKRTQLQLRAIGNDVRLKVTHNTTSEIFVVNENTPLEILLTNGDVVSLSVSENAKSEELILSTRCMECKDMYTLRLAANLTNEALRKLQNSNVAAISFVTQSRIVKIAVEDRDNKKLRKLFNLM